MSKFKQKLQHFMMGRYGVDKLNNWILGCGAILCVVAMFIPVVPVKLLMTVVSYGLLIWSMVRTLSRNTYKRYQENRKFLLFLDKLKDRQHKHFTCPRCRQVVRVPKGKGKIAITCPKCREKFIKKT